MSKRKLGTMKAQLALFCVLAASLGFRGLAAEPTEADRKLLADIRARAEKGDTRAQNDLAAAYIVGEHGLQQNPSEAFKWWLKAAEQGYAVAQHNVGACYVNGSGVEKNYQQAAKWYLKAAEQNFRSSQYAVAFSYANGLGVPKDYVVAYKWWNLAAVHGDDVDKAKAMLAEIERRMTAEEVAQGQRLAREFKPHQTLNTDRSTPPKNFSESQPNATGTGFFITEGGYFITNQHVAGEGATVRLVTATGLIAAKVVKVDQANDLALLKAEGKFTALPVIASRGVRLGATAGTVGFPNIGLQGFAPKLAKGEIAGLSGAQDDARHFQISAPIQPGNSGGALVDERGNVIGVVVAKLSQKAALATSGTLAENVNYAVKSSYLLSFLESLPEVSAKLKEPNTKDRKFEDVVKDVERATVLVVVY